MKHLAGWICALVMGLAMSAASSAAHADEFDAARAAIRKHMQKNKIPATSVALWRDGRIVWEEGFGLADKENGIPTTPHTMFCLASLSKTMTATALMTLVQAGKVDLDKPANDYLGDDPVTVHIGDPAQVTVRRLADHTSGLTASDQFFYGADVAKTPSMKETIQRYGIVVAPPGERYWYSNIGYGIVGHLVEKVSGKPYADYMREDVYLPLGMRHSAENIPAGLEKQHAIRYDYDRNPIPFYVSAEPASASIYSSAHDLARFGMFMLKNPVPGLKPVLSHASIDAMSATAINESEVPVRMAAPGDDGYGIGLVVGDMGGYHTIGHSGSTSGVSSNFILFPSENVGIVMLANVDGGLHGDILRDILKTQLPGWRDPPKAPESPKPTPAKAFEPPATLVGTWKGNVHTYEGEQPIRLKVLPSGDVHVRIGTESRWGANRSSTHMDAVLSGATFKDGQLSGRALSQVTTSDTKRRPLSYTVSLRLNLRDGEVLNGTAMATAVFNGFWESALPYWAELRKTADEG